MLLTKIIKSRKQKEVMFRQPKRDYYTWWNNSLFTVNDNKYMKTMNIWNWLKMSLHPMYIVIDGEKIYITNCTHEGRFGGVYVGKDEDGKNVYQDDEGNFIKIDYEKIEHQVIVEIIKKSIENSAKNSQTEEISENMLFIVKEYCEKNEIKFTGKESKIEIDTPLFYSYPFDFDGFIINKKTNKPNYPEYVKLNFYDYKNNNITRFKDEIRKEYEEEIKKLVNPYSIKHTKKLIKDYKKKYSFRRDIYY